MPISLIRIMSSITKHGSRSGISRQLTSRVARQDIRLPFFSFAFTSADLVYKRNSLSKTMAIAPDKRRRTRHAVSDNEEEDDTISPVGPDLHLSLLS